MQEKIQGLFENTKAEAVLLRNSSAVPESNFFYFSKLPFGHYSGSFLVLRQGRKPALITTRLETKKIPALKVRVFDSEKKLENILRAELKGAKKIGLNFDLYPKNHFLALKKKLSGKKFFDVSKALAKTRETKTREEISKIHGAARISEKAITALPRYFCRGMTEKSLALKLESILREHGDNELAFPSIVASGKTTAIPHHIASNSKIKNGLLLVDFGAKYRNYCSDLTRMFFVGRAGKKEKELYETVLEAKQLAQSLCKPGAECRKVFFKADSFLKKHAHIGLVHSVGHGLGLQVHDFPYGFGAKSKDILREGMVLTVEPGIYGKFGGIRIEDDILITKSGCKLLSKAPKELIEL